MRWFELPFGDFTLKVKVVVYNPDIHDYACLTDYIFSLAKWAPVQPATIDLTLDLCTRYPLQLGRPSQCEIRIFPDYDQCCKSNPKPFDFESNTPSTWPCVSTFFTIVDKVVMLVAIYWPSLYNIKTSWPVGQKNAPLINLTVLTQATVNSS